MRAATGHTAVLPIALLLLVATACGAAGGGGDGPAGAAGAPAPGGGLTVEEALRSAGTGPVVVRGYVVARGGDVQLCAALAESSPPQCGGASLSVEGLDPATVEGATTLEGVTWSDRAVPLAGTVAGGVLTVDPTAR